MFLFLPVDFKFIKDDLRFPEIARSSEEEWKSFWKTYLEPTRATQGSVGYDFRTPIEITLSPGQDITIPTGTKIRLNSLDSYEKSATAYYLQIHPRSSQGLSHFIRLADTTTIIFPDYFNNPETGGQIFIKIRNESSRINNFGNFNIPRGTKIAQGIVTMCLISPTI